MRNANGVNNERFAENRFGNVNGMQWYRLYGSGKSIPTWNQVFNKFDVDHRYCKTKNGIMYIINCYPEVKDQIMDELSDTIGKCVKLDDDRVKRFNEIIDSVDVIKDRKRGYSSYCSNDVKVTEAVFNCSPYESDKLKTK